MNYSVIRWLVGWVLCVEAAFLLIPLALCLCFGEPYAADYLIAIAVTAVPGVLMAWRRPKNNAFFAREGFVATTLSWIIMSLAGALPFFISGLVPNFINALFEVVSGFTTTGASILPDVEALPRSLLFWRSFTHWIGGMGVLVFLLALLPMAGGQSILIMRAESPGPSVGKLVPRLQKTAVYLYGIYLTMTLLEVAALAVGGLDLFSSFCISFGTAGTGGFGLLNDSFASYSPYVQIVVTFFMFAFGINFNFYFLLLIRKAKAAFVMEEVRAYLVIFLAAAALVTVNLATQGGMGVGSALLHSAFQCSSIMTTTGFSSVDFDLWPTFSKTVLICLMFVGACAGSTGGGIKVSRVLMYFKNISRELKRLIHPRTVTVVRLDGKALDSGMVGSVNMWLLSYIAVFFTSMLLISLDNFDFTTNFSAVAATLNNIGPGLSLVGPSRNFGDYSAFSKLVLMFDMLAGRLEIFPVLLLLRPATWRE